VKDEIPKAARLRLVIQELKAQLAKEESELRIVEEATRHGPWSRNCSQLM